MRPKPIVEKFGGLTIVNRTGKPTDIAALMDALAKADYSHLPEYPRGPRKARK
jgi:hypothetical protein